MVELSSKIIRFIVEKTPLNYQDRVANALLRQAEVHLSEGIESENVKISTSAKWYQRDREGGLGKTAAMSFTERTWFLLDASVDERDEWVSIITRNDSYSALQDLASAFEYKSLNFEGKEQILTGPTNIRERFFNTFVFQLRSTDNKVKESFTKTLQRVQEGRRYTPTILSPKSDKLDTI